MAWSNPWQRWEGAEGPIFTIGTLRVDLTILLVGMHTLAMAVGAVLAATGLGGWVTAAERKLLEDARKKLMAKDRSSDSVR